MPVRIALVSRSAGRLSRLFGGERHHKSAARITRLLTPNTQNGAPDEATREALLSSAALLVVPSRFESLSLALLEAWNHGVPALVNGRCSVLKGQSLRADGGLYYRNFDEFSRELSYLLDHADVARQLGAQGRAYVDREYRWPLVMERIEKFLAAL